MSTLPIFSKQEFEILEDAMDSYISNYASKSSSLVYHICVNLLEKIRGLNNE